ncbi:MAG: serine protease [Minwuia sp.]|nr:serine protease [Minwuia sp.]
MFLLPGQGARAETAVSTEIAESTASVVGRINHAGFRRRAHCTGFVVTGGHIVTAAHCLPEWEEEMVHFQRGYDRGEDLSHHKGQRATFRKVNNSDIAMLCNAVPDVAPLRITTQRVAPGDMLGIPGYPIPRAHILQMHSCKTWKVAKGGRIHIACPVRPGTSGAPVLVDTADGPQVVAVMSASNRTSARAHRLTPAMLTTCNTP